LISDSGNRTIRKITPDGTVTTLAGLAGALGSADGSGSAARFLYPQGIAVDAAGDIYVANADNNNIRVGGAIPVQLSSVVSRKTHGSISTPFDLPLPLLPFTGPHVIECRSVGASGDYTMVFTFANTLSDVGSVSGSSDFWAGGH
jgi:DNA-binding beta-propeller fold protein YncE